MNAVVSLRNGHAHRYRVFLAAQRLVAARKALDAAEAEWRANDGTLRATPEAAQAEQERLSETERRARSEADAALRALLDEVEAE